MIHDRRGERQSRAVDDRILNLLLAGLDATQSFAHPVVSRTGSVTSSCYCKVFPFRMSIILVFMNKRVVEIDILSEREEGGCRVLQPPSDLDTVTISCCS